MGVSKNRGIPKWMVYNAKTPIFWKHPYENPTKNQETKSNLGSLGFLRRKSKGCSVRVPVQSKTVLPEGSNQQMRTEAGKVFKDLELFL